ncbi:unnamed protein product [Sphagnum troendelagicum]|uniref:Uncharacterized protein n=1 Tax=Sphagnum troendelagicum TaxID=128251 RepID=A0ABP0TA80_9BRYO
MQQLLPTSAAPSPSGPSPIANAALSPGGGQLYLQLESGAVTTSIMQVSAAAAATVDQGKKKKKKKKQSTTVRSKSPHHDHHGRAHVNSLLPLSQEAAASMLTSLEDHQQLSIKELREEYCYSNMMMIMSPLGSCCSKLEFGKSNGVTILTIIICRPCAMIFLASSSMSWSHHGGARRG